MKRQELYINGTLVDLKDDLQTYFNYRRSDIENPDKKQSDFSYSITLPGSKTNDKLFGFLFEIRKDIDTSGSVNFTPDFNPNLKTECVYYVESVEQFRGVANLKEIRVKHDREVEYDLVLYGRLMDIVNAMGDDELADIVDISEYNHEYTLANVTNSWATSIIRNGVTYDNFQGSVTSNFPNGQPSGEGYVYPLIDYGFTANMQDFNLINLYPACYIKTIWDKIFAYYGFTYDSTILNSAEFKTIVMPFTSPFMKLTASQILDRKFRAEKTSSTQLSVNVGTANAQSSTVVFDDDSSVGNFDTSSQYNTGTGIFTVGTGLSGIHSFTTRVIVKGEFIPDTPGISVKSLNLIRSFVQLVKQDAAGNITVLNSVSIDIDHTDFFTTSYTTSDPASVTPFDPDYTTSPFNPRNYVNLTATNVSLIATDKVFVRVTRYAIPNNYGNNTQHTPTQLFHSGTTFYGGQMSLYIQGDSYFYNNIDNTQIIEGQTVLMNNTLPQKVKVKDWFMSIVKKFNLQIEPDSDIPNKLNIETYDDYYANDVLDWTDKLDISQDLKIIPMGALDARRYIFKDKDDTDYYNQRYKDTYKRTYGEREITVLNDFVTNEKKVETIFSPTPCAGQDFTDMVIPRFIKVDSNGTVSSHESNIRLLYYGGLKDSNTVWSIITNSGATSYGQYPYAGHLDDPYNPTKDLNFGIPFEIYWKPLYHSINWSNNNAYNRFWKRDIEERIDRNSKIVECWMRLRPIDILNISFRKKYYFKDEFFRLLNVFDYNPRTEGLTKCRFIKIKEASAFVAEINDGVNEGTGVGSDEILPNFGSGGTFNENTGTASDVIILGGDNRVASGARNVFINGEANSVGEFTDNINLLSASGNIILGGVKNIVMVNTYGKRINESNQFIVNGQSISGRDSIVQISYTGSTITRDSAETATFHEVDCSGGAITIELENPANWAGNIRYFKKMDATANAMTIDGYGSATIDGVASKSTTTQYVVFAVYSDGSNYRIVHNG